MSVASELQTLVANKAAIKSAIEAKNPATAPTNALAQWPTAIASIPSGGGGGLTGYTLTIYGETNMDGYDYLAVVYTDGRIDLIDTSNELYVRNTIVLHDVVGYTQFTSVSNIGSYVALTGDTTITMKALCLVRGTLVTLANGTAKPIEEITYDDELLVWDFENGTTASAKPLWIKQRGIVSSAFKASFANGKDLYMTGAHGHRAFNIDQSRFEYIPRSVGDRVFTIDGESEIVSCEKVSGEFDYYNIITDKHFNLFANGVLTSCRLNNYREFNCNDMRFASKPETFHDRSEFEGIPDSYIDGLRLCEQPASTDELKSYVERLIKSAK